tara:strand:+ start:659 stop:865 length:207 start_codon:yes stop_codon:yes gene_type:complete
MLNVALGHHRGLAGTCSSVKDNVAIQIQPEALGVPERMVHQRPPPRKATPQAEATEHDEHALEGVGFT